MQWWWNSRTKKAARKEFKERETKGLEFEDVVLPRFAIARR